MPWAVPHPCSCSALLGEPTAGKGRNRPQRHCLVVGCSGWHAWLSAAHLVLAGGPSVVMAVGVAGFS